MNNRTDQENLLAEVLAEAVPPDFRATLLAETLRHARHRRQFRLARRAAGVLAVLILLALFTAQPWTKKTIVAPSAAKEIAPPSYELVHTQPLPARALVHTRTFLTTGLATTIPSVTEITTVSGGFRLINDDELLALLADKPAILIRTGPNSEELVFANPADQKKFLFY
jgi:hypothetical protein